jgi:hypothetical protein
VSRIVGLDLDNTLALYDELFHGTARSHGLVDASVPATKREVRDAVRRSQGDIAWQRLQGEVYGPRMSLARLAEGVVDFLQACRVDNAAVVVVSHKTQHATYDETGTDLRQAALRWMADQGLFDVAGGILTRGAVFFESTRAEKLARIEALDCTHFVDDLIEVFLEERFPDTVSKVLIDPSGATTPPAGVRLARSWSDVAMHVLGSAA